MADKILEDSVSDPNWPFILLVEDNIQMLHYLQQQLKSEYNVMVAENGLQALNKMESRQKPDLILSDIMMDEMDGFAFLKELSRNNLYKDIPLIFITAKTTQKDSLEGLSLGAVDFIQKPFDYIEIKLKINSILSNKASQREAVMNAVVKAASQQLKNTPDQPINFETQEFFEGNCAKYNFTEREKEIVALVKQGAPYKKISDQLNISERTVVRHIQNMFGKTNTHNKLDLLNCLFRS